MKKFLNDPDALVSDSLRGFASAHGHLVALNIDPTYMRRQARGTNEKVVVVSGGGSGHEPLDVGYVGYGMLDLACPGEIFTSPSPDQMAAAVSFSSADAGVIFVVKNYSGDVLNFQIASDMLTVPTETVLVDDDVAVDRSTRAVGRRGVAGTLVVQKIVGAAAEQGLPLSECKRLGDKSNKVTASIGVALTSCSDPISGKRTFEIGSDEIEFGVGIHGEPGRQRETLENASRIVRQMLEELLSDLAPANGARVLLLVNGLGGTPLVELYHLYHLARTQLQACGIAVDRSLVGNYVTSLDMAGASITLTILDEELKQLWDSPVRTASLNW